MLRLKRGLGELLVIRHAGEQLVIRVMPVESGNRSVNVELIGGKSFEVYRGELLAGEARRCQDVQGVKAQWSSLQDKWLLDWVCSCGGRNRTTQDVQSCYRCGLLAMVNEAG
jgi:hypothetical protein